MPTIQIVVLGAVPPLCRPRPADHALVVTRWLVFACPRRARAMWPGGGR